MDFHSLRCFDAAATTLNFRSASARVHLSAAAFSDRIQRLEGELGVELFARTTRKIALTDGGRSLLPIARQALEAESLLHSTSQAPTRVAPFELFIGTRAELGLSWLCPSIKELQRLRPERTLHLHTGDTGDLLARVERGELDALVASMRLTSPNLSYATLHAEEYDLVAADRCLRRRADASRCSLIDVSRDLPLFRYFLDALPDAEPWPFARFEYMGGIGNIRRRLLDCPNSIAVLPRYFVRPDIAAGRLVRLVPGMKLRPDAFRLVWRRDHPRSHEMLALAESLRALPLR